MKDFFKGSSFKVLAIAVVVLLGLAAFTATAGGAFVAGLLGFVSAPMQSIATDVTGNMTEFLDLESYSKEDLQALVEQLQQERSALAQQLVDYEEKKRENEQLKQQLAIAQLEPENEMRSASVIGRDPNEVFAGFSIDKGSLSGVSEGDPVITSQGLVGVVSQVYATSSMVTCLLSEDLQVAAVSIDREESGVITSDIMTASAGLLRLNYLSSETKLEKGDIITTSGAGGAYPANIIIGEVQSVEKSENDISKYAVVKPYEDLAHVKDVQVIVSFPGKGEEASVLPEGEEDPAKEDGE